MAEFLVPYSSFDLQSVAIQVVDEAQPTPTFLSFGAAVSYEATGNRLGGPCRKFLPPTADGGYSGYGQFQLNRNGAFGFQRMALRFEMQVGATWGTNNAGDAVKLLIVNMTDTLGGNATTRPMLYLDSRPGDGADGLKPLVYVGLGLAQGTNKRYSATAQVDYMDGTTPFFFGPAAGVWNGRPIVGANEWVSISYYMSSVAEAGFQNGRLWMTVTRQSGAILAGFSFPYTIGANNPADYFATMDILGGYFNFATVQQANVDNYIKIAHPTFQAGATAPLPPRFGFAPALPGILPAEFAGWTKPNDTSLRSSDGTIEIGDVAQTVFYPQFKQKEYNNQANFSLRLVLPDYTPDSLGILGNEVRFAKGAIQCRMKFETGLPQTVIHNGIPYTYVAADRFGFSLVLTAAPLLNTFDFSAVVLNTSLHLQPALTALEITNGAVREANVINSIAIKNTLGLRDARGSTKIGHLYRPRVTDSAGAGIWGDWSIVNAGTLRITIPQAFLTTATYPVTVN